MFDEGTFRNEGKSGTKLTAVHDEQSRINNSLWKVDMQAPRVVRKIVPKP